MFSNAVIFGFGMAVAWCFIPLGFVVIGDGAIDVGGMFLTLGLIGAAIAYFADKDSK